MRWLIALVMLVCTAKALFADPDTDAYANRLRSNYSAPPLRALGAGHAEVYRTWIVNSTGKDVQMLTAIKRPGEQATIAMVSPANHRTLRAPLSNRQWLGLVESARGFDRVVPRPDPETELCIDAWGSVAEAIDAHGKVRRGYGDPCRDDPAWLFVGKFDQLAIQALPGCKWLLDERVGQLTAPLHVCTLLSGNRKAAAQAALWLQFNGISVPFDPYTDSLDDLLADASQARWPGRAPMQGRYDIGAALLEDFEDWSIETHWIRGVGPGRVVLEATLDPSRLEAKPKAKPVPIALTFNRKADGGYELIRIAPR